MKELSGPQWVSRYPGSVTTSDLALTFKRNVESFLAALKAAGIKTSLNSTYRPLARSYLMHWCWKIKHGTKPEDVPAMDGVNIDWVHPTAAASLNAAKKMVTAFQMDHLHTPPALRSLHNEGNAIDMTISWSGSVDVKDASGTVVTVNSAPRSGMNRQLKTIGATYGVKKFVGGDRDKPHWSATGH